MRRHGVARMGDIVVVQHPVHPATLAAKNDLVIYVGDLVEGLGFIAELERLGVTAILYPLDTWRAPTLPSLLGLTALIQDSLKKTMHVAIVDSGPAYLVVAAHGIVWRGWSLGGVDADKLTSPLHYRILAALEALRRGGVDLVNEATANKQHALTGGDAAKSDRTLLAADIEHQLGPKGLAATAYRGRPLEPPYDTLLESLDPHGEGAVEVLALRKSGGMLDAYIGCRLHLHPLGCAAERRNVEPALIELARRLRIHLRELAETTPEEAACIAYPEYGC